jgi:hypothetical protein
MGLGELVAPGCKGYVALLQEPELLMLGELTADGLYAPLSGRLP